MINPRNNFNIALGTRYRKENNEIETQNTQTVWFAVRTSLKNIYRDFLKAYKLNTSKAALLYVAFFGSNKS